MTVLLRIAPAVLLMASITAMAVQGGGFFGTAIATPRQMALFDDAQRTRLLQGAHACNKAGKTLGEQRQCDEWEHQARQVIQDRVRQFHEQAKPQRAELRALHWQQRGW